MYGCFYVNAEILGYFGHKCITGIVRDKNAANLVTACNFYVQKSESIVLSAGNLVVYLMITYKDH